MAVHGSSSPTIITPATSNNPPKAFLGVEVMLIQKCNNDQDKAEREVQEMMLRE
jgi:hypothetical protein